MAYGREPSEARAARRADRRQPQAPRARADGGRPGTLLAAVFLHERTGHARWAELFCDTADTLWSQLEWSAECGCHFWTQDLYGRRSTYLDAVHGFVATASPLARGRTLLGEAAWTRWHEVI